MHLSIDFLKSLTLTLTPQRINRICHRSKRVIEFAILTRLFNQMACYFTESETSRFIVWTEAYSWQQCFLSFLMDRLIRNQQLRFGSRDWWRIRRVEVFTFIFCTFLRLFWGWFRAQINAVDTIIWDWIILVNQLLWQICLEFAETLVALLALVTQLLLFLVCRAGMELL